MKIIGYGICGPGEASRYMRETMEEFKRLCDKTIILVNARPEDAVEEIRLINEFGFGWVGDTREWGKMQWKIKQDFIKQTISKGAQAGDIMIALDMDERFDKHLTREWLMKMEYDAPKIFVVDLWNDPEHYKPESCFWNTRIWRWNGDTEWIAKPVHCGLAPRWAVAYNRYAPFLLIHKGLMAKEDRARKIERYAKYDPHAQHLGKPYYAMLHSDTAEPFDEEALHATIAKEVATYKQTKPRNSTTMATPKGRYAYVQNPVGVVIDIPEKQLAETLKRGGFSFVGWADEAEKEMEEMFAEDEGGLPPPPSTGSYQRPMADEKDEVDARNAVDDGLPVAEASVPTKNRVGMKEAEKIRKVKKAKK